MKIHVPTLLCSLLLAAASVAAGGSVPALDVTVSNAAGKIAYKGKTTGSGTFATGKLDPGNYIVQFNSNSPALKGNQFAVVVSAGKKKVSADAVAGDKFGKGGVAMKVDVGAGLNITGQVVNGQMAGAQTANSSGNAKTRIINGKKYIWVGSETGSNMGGHWVEEGMANVPGNVQRGGADRLRSIQDRGTNAVSPGGG